tara:strand:+ start:423 stop:581 length:159 start_codon:yes stop_codon:yes gene_type:complete
MTSRELEQYVRDVVNSMDIGDLIQYANERLYEYYMNNLDQAIEEAKDFYGDE